MIKVTFPDNRTEELPPETKGFQILDRFSVNPESIIAIRINNEICSLDLPITIRANLEPVTIQNSDGMNIYRRSLCFVLGTAASELFPEKNLVVGHSLGYGYYYTYKRLISIVIHFSPCKNCKRTARCLYLSGNKRQQRPDSFCKALSTVSRGYVFRKDIESVP